jgi:hypothetical protein
MYFNKEGETYCRTLQPVRCRVAQEQRTVGRCSTTARMFPYWARFTVCVFLFCKPVHSQDSREFWPEIDAYVNPTPASRFYFFAAVGKQEDIPTFQGDFGGNIDFFSSRSFALVRDFPSCRRDRNNLNR